MSGVKLGSTPLADANNEEFCQHYVKELDKKAAFIATYRRFMTEQIDTMSPAELARRAGSMMRRKGIKDRVSYLIASNSQATAPRISDEFEEIGFANILDFVDFDDGRVEMKKSKDISRTKARAIKSVKMTKYGLVLELHDKMAALDRLSRRHPELMKPSNDDDGPTQAPTMVLFDRTDTKQIEAVAEMKRRTESLEDDLVDAEPVGEEIEPSSVAEGPADD